MTKRLFGTDGIRAVAGEYPLDKPTVTQIGKAIGVYFAKPGELILVGYDPRESSPELAANIVAGITTVGVNTELVGVIPTPGLAHATKNSQAVAGVMITASHNPYTDNGIKAFGGDGGKLPDEAEDQLSALIASDIPSREPGNSTENSSYIAAYEDYLVSTLPGTSFAGLKLVVDTANGAASGIGARVLSRLDADVTPVADQPNGTNINAACGATDTKMLRETVIREQADGGIAFDGDSDRVMLVDAQGRQLDGDHIMYILATTGEHKGVVATIMSNMGLEQALAAKGIDLVRTAVGDRYVLEGLEETGYHLGGEQSGHIILPEYQTTGDGILAAIHTLKAVQASGKSLAEWYDALSLLPQALVNIPVADKTLLDRPAIQQYVTEQADKFAGKGRLSIRPSGTEPKARVMVEYADAQAEAERIASELQTLLEKES